MSMATSLSFGLLRGSGLRRALPLAARMGGVALTARPSPVTTAPLTAGSSWTQSARTLKMYYGNESTEITGFRRWLFKAAGFNQYGLYYHDCLHETDDVKEAVRRLSPQAQDERAFRIQRALHLSMRKVVLPREEWPTLEEDIQKGRYLKDLLKEIEAENAEKKEWEAKI
ncbi:hypothetical protein TCAL_07371 [Tigriopus californicus]|uniref:Cytochrome b-c1 complex subunit 7 n=1 Tax=Tigriopus californicus TaxID=6832 RepID=A0A553PNC9_TIGCA|nr:cytochrome b-c1 complex subunit 7-like [Tigriopus californicus]TRY79189.1 hypothetical protein TCAL_07371 [Tigriopus californicus]|eukprot:TCALIF_07371-PA protein Name:"Similar to UQCRB Cytochrome b-c1 complex subunit 7 (Bos taurus)" AED:0.00 eAED:0.00 QI:149/1/1/1/1/1/2/103/169